MVSKCPQVWEYISLSPVFVFEKNNLFNSLNIMRNFKVDSLPVINEEFSIMGMLNKRQVIRVIKKNFKELKTTNICDIFDSYSVPMVLYQRMTIFEAYRTLKCLNVKGLPVADLPWEKRIIGYLWLDDIKTFIEKTYIKIPV